MVLVAVSVAIAGHMGYLAGDPTRDNEPILVDQTAGDLNSVVLASETPKAADVSIRVEEVLNGLEVPWSIVFTDDSRMLLTERSGQIQVAHKNDQGSWSLESDPIHIVPNVSSQSEEGLMGMALDPDYANNKYLYICYAYEQSGQMFDRVVRYVDDQVELTQGRVLLDRIPAARFHAGCELSFGPDGKLYISTGDASDRNLAQQMDSLAGKILRINADGIIPEDNPFDNSAVFSLGHRNPQGFDWHPESQTMFASEHGPSGFDGPGGGDEINLISSGQNYGWPVVSHEDSEAGMVDPKLVFTPAIAPGSLVFYDSDQISGFKNNIFVGLLKGEGILRVVLNPEDHTQVLWYERLPNIELGRIREMTMGPDGHLYFSTSNRDGRGSPSASDDRVFRIIPE